jgi:hypothetical protein
MKPLFLLLLTPLLTLSQSVSSSNARSIQGTAVSGTPPTNNQVLIYSSASHQYVPSTGAPGSGVTSVATSCGISGGPITSTGTVQNSIATDSQTGSGPYAIPSADCGKLISRNNAAAVSDTIAQAGGSFPAGWYVPYQCSGAGGCTITPATSTINGGAALVLVQGQGVQIVSDGTNYSVLGSLAIGGVPTTTVAGLPASPSGNPTYLVTDGVSASDCSTGVSSFLSLCTYVSGNGWVSVPWTINATSNLDPPAYAVVFDGAENPLTIGLSGTYANGVLIPLTASPTFTGVPAAPSASAGTNTAQLATTAFVHGNTLLTRTINGNFTPTGLAACEYVAFAGTINGFHATVLDGATASTVLIKVETQANRTTFLSTGVSGASDISNGGEQLTSVLGKDDTTLTSWTTTFAAGTTVCLVASGFSLGTAVNANVTLQAN